MIKAALDYIPLTFSQFSSHFLNTFSIERPLNAISNHRYSRISGYSCRSIFDTTMKFYIKKYPDIKILTTPIHHTSFRNIIEKYVKPENIYILEMNDKYNKIVGIPDDCGSPINVDLCIITHVFGQDLDCSILEEYKTNNSNCIIIEDRVQGGDFEKIFSYDFMDISMYSTGMDKKPCGLGGGFMCINNKNHERPELFNHMLLTISSYPQEYFYNRLMFLTKKIPTYFLYNFKTFIGVLLMMFWYFNIDLHSFASKYRKSNPGFSHDGFNKNPSNGTLVSIEKSVENYHDIEQLYIKKSIQFYKLINENARNKMMPWINGEYTLTPYNTVIVDDRDKFVKYLNKTKIPVIENPTYKIFNFDYEGSEKYKNFNDSIVYIPSLAIMNEQEMKYLAMLINNYYCKNT